MQKERQVWTCCRIVALTIASAFAQKATLPPNSAPNVQIVRVRTGISCGWCTSNYHDNEATIESGSIVRVNRSSDQKAYPDLETKYRITKRDWVDLQHFIDARVLAAFNDRTGCPGCADESVVWVEVQFSDGTKKSVGYNRGEETPPITALLQKIATIEARAKLQQ
jgi:hypothetical protein